jgi:hypothetical protein
MNFMWIAFGIQKSGFCLSLPMNLCGTVPDFYHAVWVTGVQLPPAGVVKAGQLSALTVIFAPFKNQKRAIKVFRNKGIQKFCR